MNLRDSGIGMSGFSLQPAGWGARTVKLSL
jgi:hypothetical protein